MSANGVGENSTDMAKPLRRRRKYLVNPGFQWRYAISLSLAVFLVSSILSCAVFTTLHEQARHRIIHPSAYSTNTGMVILLSAFGFSVLTAGAVAFWMIITTHRICGPVFVLDRHFRQLAAGSVPNLRPLRRKDEFKDLFKSFTRAVDRVRADKEAALSVITKAHAAARSDRHMDEQACRQALDSISRQLDSLRRNLAEGLGTGLSDAPAAPATPNKQAGVAPAARTAVGVG